MSNSMNTPEGIASFPWVFEPKTFADGSKKYQLTLLIKKTPGKTMDNDPVIAEIRAKIEAAAAAKWPDAKTRPRGSKLRLPLTDGDIAAEEDTKGLYGAYAGHWALATNETRQPVVVDRQCKAILDRNQVYPGCIVRLHVDFFAYDTDKAKGVSCGLKYVQKRGDGTRLGTSVVASEEQAASVFAEDAVGAGSDDI